MTKTRYTNPFGRDRAYANPFSSFEYCKRLERAAEEFDNVTQYALQIGCTIVADEIVCHTEEQERLLLARWKEWNDARLRD
jgi:hypothetical protein